MTAKNRVATPIANNLCLPQIRSGLPDSPRVNDGRSGGGGARVLSRLWRSRTSKRSTCDPLFQQRIDHQIPIAFPADDIVAAERGERGLDRRRSAETVPVA